MRAAGGRARDPVDGGVSAPASRRSPARVVCFHEVTAQPHEPLDRVAFQRDASRLFASHPQIAAAYLFGSVAKGAQRSDSDLDIGLVYDTSSEAGTHDAIASALAPELSKLTGIDAVDVVDLQAQGPLFAHAVLCEGQLLYEADRERRVDFESDTMVRAFDFRPTYELATAGKIATLRRWLQERYDL